MGLREVLHSQIDNSAVFLDNNLESAEPSKRRARIAPNGQDGVSLAPGWQARNCLSIPFAVASAPSQVTPEMIIWSTSLNVWI